MEELFELIKEYGKSKYELGYSFGEDEYKYLEKYTDKTLGQIRIILLKINEKINIEEIINEQNNNR